jgi:hypothetical protein
LLDYLKMVAVFHMVHPERPVEEDSEVLNMA